MTPKTHILLRKGTETLCDAAISSTYRIGDSWYKIALKAFKVNNPEILHPTITSSWVYENPGILFTTGIYTLEELEKLQERILYPLEQPAVLNTIARGMTGHQVNTEGMSMDYLLNDESVEKIKDSFWSRTWAKFSLFGNTVAGLIGMILILRILKDLVDCILQGYALHRVYGWSLKLLGGILSRVQ